MIPMNPGWITAPLGGHWRNDHCRYVSIQFIRRDNQAWTAFLDFVTNGVVEVYQIDFESFYFHSHSSLSQEVRPIASRSSRLSSPFAGSHDTEFPTPILPGFRRSANQYLLVPYLKFDLTLQPCLFQHHLWDSYPLRVSNANDARLHRSPPNRPPKIITL